jgi:hypothetical protein
MSCCGLNHRRHQDALITYPMNPICFDYNLSMLPDPVVIPELLPSLR